MRSFPLYVDGRDVTPERWTYVMHADAVIGEPRRTFAVKRGLELGRDVASEDLALVAGRCAWGGEDENVRALEAAAKASRELRGLTPADRHELGRALNARLRDRRDEAIDVLIAEGHPRRLAEWEIDGLIQGSDERTLAWAFDYATQRFAADGRELLLTRKPDGVVCISPPQNAAMSNAGLGVMSLLAGNALVIKAPKTSPLGVMFLFRELLVPVLEAFGMPRGAINLVSGYSSKIVRQWIASPHVDDVMFFGDSAAGLRFGEECVANGKKPILELSGNDAFMVWRDADLDAAAEALTECFWGSGQICMVPKQAILHPAIADEFIERFCAIAAEVRPGYPSDPDVVLSPVLKADRFYDYLGEARLAGAQQLIGGRRVDVAGEPAAGGLFLEPTAVRVNGLDRARELSCVREETFFPLVPLVVAERRDDAALLERFVDWCDSNRYGLRNSLWAADPEVIDTFVVRVRNGGLLKVNDSHVGFAPYLGTHGGTGITGGPFGELHYPMLRTSHLQGISIGAPTAREAKEPALARGAQSA